MTGLYICYWSFQDPLCQTQSLAYLRTLAKRGHKFALITFEQPQCKTTPTQKKRIKRELQQEGIAWYPLKYHKRFPMLATAYDCVRGILMGVWIALRHRPQVIHSRSSVASAMALAVANVCRLKFLYDADATLSEEYTDHGHWSRDSGAFRVTAWVESQARKRAHSIVVLSEKLRDDFRQEFGVSAPIEVIPCCVNVEAFQFNQATRESCRRELGIVDERLFVYVGKAGTRSLVDEMFDFFKVAQARLGSPARLLILSGEEPEVFHRIAEKRQVSHDHYSVKYVGRERVSRYLAASDAGLAFIRSARCERGSSPIKIGEYLAAGLPVVMTERIGDYSEWVAQHDLGVVIGKLDEEHYAEAVKGLMEIWAKGNSFRTICRQFAETKISIETVGAPRYGKVYEGLLRDL
ncbi:MAG TPA: glycosyltransferase [Pyrinomonadaceae bacterium]